MTDLYIQMIFQDSYHDFLSSGAQVSAVQKKAARAIMQCKTPKAGYTISECEECGHVEYHYNSCRNRNCPNCQALKKELWVDERSSEVIDAPYFHVVFTLPHELNPIIYNDQKLLYNHLHRCCAETILELSADRKYLGAEPGIIQVLHTWNQEIDYHVHMHCIVSGGGLTTADKLVRSKDSFFIPVYVLRDKFKGKYLCGLRELYNAGKISLPESLEHLKESSAWDGFINELYSKDWCPYIKSTFNGFGNAIEYLGKYTHKIAISNYRIIEATEEDVIFSARGLKKGDPRREITLTREEFIRRFLMHVLPKGFQKIRYFGFLSNRKKKKKLALIFKLQNGQRFKAKYTDMTVAEMLKALFGTDIKCCPECACVDSMRMIRKVPGS